MPGVRGHTAGRRASRLEVVGAWLGIWTPPREVEVPVFPVRTAAILTLAALVVVGGTAALVVPRISQAKRSAAAREASAAAARDRQRRRQTAVDQRASFFRFRPVNWRSATARDRVVAVVEARIETDVAHRVATGELQGTPRATTCRRTPGTAERGEVGIFDCLSVVSDIAATARNVAGAIGYPFRAVIHYATGRAAWCKTNPVPGERVVPRPGTVVELPAVCRADQAGRR